MITNIECANVNYALSFGLTHLLSKGVTSKSRNGDVIVAPRPVCTTYYNATHRVLFCPLRDANPYFHLMEALWMLAGRNDVAWPAYFAGNIKNYSDDGETLHGAYGHRWKKHFTMDQIEFLLEELKNPNTRRAVLGMWDPDTDIEKALQGGKDVPCNTHAYFSINYGSLDMLVGCRSNDVIWGAYGANVVHFSILQEYVARMLNVAVGIYRQFSNNYHVYTDKYSSNQLSEMAKQSQQHNYYQVAHGEATVQPFPLLQRTTRGVWMAHLREFLSNPLNDDLTVDPFFMQIARPMYRSWHVRKTKEGDGMKELMAMPANNDWRRACERWITRRKHGSVD